MSGRARVRAEPIAAVGAGGVGLAAFLPWVRSGHASRSSFQAVRTAELLDLVHGPGLLVLRAWYLVPVLVAVVWLAIGLDQPVVAGVVSSALGAVALLTAVVVLASGVPTGLGPPLTVVAALVTATGGVLTLRSARRPS